jgi:hypothetical protein
VRSIQVHSSRGAALKAALLLCAMAALLLCWLAERYEFSRERREVTAV